MAASWKVVGIYWRSSQIGNEPYQETKQPKEVTMKKLNDNSKRTHCGSVFAPSSLSFRVMRPSITNMNARKARLARVSRAHGDEGKLYILTGQKPIQIEGAENLILLSVQASKGALGPWAASKMECFAWVEPDNSW